MKIIDDQPELYASFLPSFFWRELPRESFATCTNCAMACHDDSKKKNLTMQPFREDAKCCTYHPKLPGYLVGAILCDESLKEGRNRIKEKIKNKTGVSPRGIYPSAKYSLLYSNSAGVGFGQSSYFICPYFDKEKGNCTIWKYREAVCSTYFCKTVAGEKGKSFWNAVNAYLATIQEKLILYTLVELGGDFQPYANEQKLSVNDLDDLPPAETEYKSIWGNWAGKEEEFYIESYQLVKKLGGKEFDSIVGIDQKVLLNRLQKEEMQMLDIPSRLIKTNDEELLNKADEETYTVKYRAIDSIFQLPVEVLDYFDGERETNEVIRALEEEAGIEIEKDIVLSLYHYGILKEFRKTNL